MIGALAAAHRGASVLLLECELEGPSNLRVSGGLFPGAGTRFQRAQGIHDSPASFARDIRAKAGGTANEAIVEAVANRSADAIHFLADACGIPVQLVTKIAAAGHSLHRLHATPAQSGRELLSLLRKAVKEQSGISIREERVKDLESFKAPVLLATGGFAGNKALLREFLPEVADALHIGAGPNDGCAIEWGRARGAALAGMDGYQGQGHVNPGGRTRLGMALPRLGRHPAEQERRALRRRVDRSVRAGRGGAGSAGRHGARGVRQAHPRDGDDAGAVSRGLGGGAR